MGSHFVRVYSVDAGRLRAMLGTNDRNTLKAWLKAIREQAGMLAEEDIEAREAAAEQLSAGGVPPGERPDGHHFGHAFLALCDAWADRRAVVECYVTETFPALWVLAAGAGLNPFGVPQSLYAAGHVGWHDPARVPSLRQALAAARVGGPDLAQLGGTAENIASLDAVLAHAETTGRGVVVSWAA